MTTQMGIAVVGCGNISEIYLKNLTRSTEVTVKACADAMPERAEARAAQFGLPAKTLDAVLADPAIDLVLNLTPPVVHYPVGLAALDAGKALYTEKPLAVMREEGRHLLDLSRQRGLRLGAAPDTFLGGGLQTCREVIDEGTIGLPVAATAFFLGHGPEGWHPDPSFFYRSGGGPLFDMGPYYVTTLVALLGPVRRVTGIARASFAERTIGSGALQGTAIPVEIPTHIAGVLEFASGAIATLVTSFDVWAAEVPRLEIYGSEGSLSLPDPNFFEGPVRVRRPGEEAWREVPISRPYTANVRGIGVADLAAGVRQNRPHRASGEMAFHVLDVMHAIEDASREGRHIEVASTCERPEPMASDAREHLLDR